MTLIPVKVQSYSGYKVDEHPGCFYLEDIQFMIEDIVDRWYQSETNPEWPASDYFKVKTSSGSDYILKHELKKDEWFLQMR